MPLLRLSWRTAAAHVFVHVGSSLSPFGTLALGDRSHVGTTVPGQRHCRRSRLCALYGQQYGITAGNNSVE